MLEHGLSEHLRALDVGEMGGALEDSQARARDTGGDQLGMRERSRRILRAGDDEHGRGDVGDLFAGVPACDRLAAACVALGRGRDERRAEAR